MNKPIKKGDMVVIIRRRSCGCPNKNAGPYTVGDVFVLNRPAICGDCRAHLLDTGTTVARFVGRPLRNVIEPRRLLKIEPPSKEQTTDQQQEISA